MTTLDPFGTIPQGAPGTPAPFNLRVSDGDLVHFKSLLQLSKIAPPTYENLKGGKHALGLTRDWLAFAKNAWLNDFDWRDHEAHINSFPNFKIPIADEQCGTLDIHFAGLFSTRQDATPLVFLHGWPGSFAEFLPVLDLLREKYTPHTLPYHVVVPSLPGYTLSSGPPVDRDFRIEDAARYLNTLMVQLGFGKGYVAQGGDVGYFVGSVMSSTFEECKALHVNFLLLHPPEIPESTQGLTPHDLKLLEKAAQWRTTGSGYALEHATRPATIGLALSSSPLALLAWTAEKFIDDSDEPLPLAVILRMVSLYWFTESFPRGLYPYRAALLGPDGVRMCREKPLGYSHFKEEFIFLPRAWEWRVPNLRFRRDHDRGGHFAALEQPGLLLADVEEFVREVVGSVEL